IEIEDFFISFWLVVGSIGLFLILYVLSLFILKFVKKVKVKISKLELRQALNGLFRIGNKTILVISSITLSLTILFTISFVQLNLENQFVKSFPENAPNFFVLDVPKENLTQIEKIIGEEVVFYPVVRGSILKINDIDVKKVEENKGRTSDSLLRPFSLTYGNLLETEEIVETTNPGEIFENEWNYEESDVVQMSILDDVAKIMDVKIGDRVVFLIQGIEIESQIVSIRTRTQEGINAFFYFTFEEEVLKDAPQTVFTITKVDSEKIPLIQNDIVKAFPSVTVINGESTAKTVGEIIGQLSKVVSFFTFFSLGAGILILLSSIVSTNIQRTQEAIFYKLVGANRSFITKVFIFEYLFIGILSSIIALLLSSLATYSICKFFLEIDFIFLSYQALIYSISTVIIIVVIGYLSSINVIRKKPIEYIRENKLE
ncbi:MAG: hypothetical protein KC589_08710, partial [Nanoarchaeota archaeon]|nr:hypothetical protein [Nanoarchaeota archaeon]